GISWAPSYRLDLNKDGQGALAMSCVIKNELADLDKTRVFGISGFPAVQFGHVASPLDLSTTWAAFFSQLAQDPSQRNRNYAIAQQVMMNTAVDRGGASVPDLSSFKDGLDLHFQDLGRLTLGLGQAAYLPVAEKDVEYERLVEWVIPDNRDEFGRPYEPRHRSENWDREQDAVWDAARFANPFSFPLTTAPVAVREKELFSGQNMLNWTAPGEKALVRITRALNVRALHTESEVQGKRETLSIGGRTFQRSLVEGTMILKSYRGRQDKVIIRRRFSGRLVEAEGSPEKRLAEGGVFSVNERNELVWEVELAPGKETTLKYRYEALVCI
ncbi:MAG TPA: hypothetical protein P5137_06100, partial [Candidatus Brocadiia bacterium]|nr:hypothetical protein [Candidatus Brocadiia bacterium]